MFKMEISKKSAFLVVVLLSLSWGAALAGEIPSAQEMPPLKPAAQWQYGEISVHLKNGKILAGFLLGLEAQAVGISVAQGRKAIPLSDFDRYEFSNTRLSGVVYTQFECFLYPNLSLGLIADYVYGPSVQVPAYPEMGLAAQSLRFGSASVGFVLGTHF